MDYQNNIMNFLASCLTQDEYVFLLKFNLDHRIKEVLVGEPDVAQFCDLKFKKFLKFVKALGVKTKSVDSALYVPREAFVEFMMIYAKPEYRHLFVKLPLAVNEYHSRFIDAARSRSYVSS